MKRLRNWMVLLACIAVAAVVMAAAPTHVHNYADIGDATVDADYTGTWDSLGALIYTADDTFAIVIQVSGVAVMTSSDRLYLGLGHNSTTPTSADLDTFIVQAPRFTSGRCRIPFNLQLVYSDTAWTDTLFLQAASGGGSSVNYVGLEDVVMQTAVMDD